MLYVIFQMTFVDQRRVFYPLPQQLASLKELIGASLLALVIYLWIQVYIIQDTN